MRKSKYWSSNPLCKIDYMTLAYAVHRLSGVVSPANAAYSASELEFQLKSSGTKALFTVSQFKRLIRHT